MFTRRQLLLGGAPCALAAAYPILVEPRWFEVTRTGVALKGIRHHGIRILHLTDLHASWAVPMPSIREAIQIGLRENPDLILLTGDFISHRDDFDDGAYVTALRKLTAHSPTFAVLGNHDGGSWAKDHRGFAGHLKVERILEDAGVELLHNRAAQARVRDLPITLVGVGDLWSNELFANRAFQSVAEGPPTILLAHNPDAKELLAAFPWDLMLSGHTHGGQVIVPFQGPRYAPVKDKRFVAGLGEWNGRQIYVSRGVGSVGGIRFRCRPEVTILDIGAGPEVTQVSRDRTG